MNSNQRVHCRAKARHVIASGISDPGIMRSENEDSILLDSEGKFMLLADGMGGHERGGEASATALDIIKNYLQPDVITAEMAEITGGSGLPSEISCIISLVDEAVCKANSVIFERNKKIGAKRFMGTTLTGIVTVNRTYIAWFHVGDSRVYRWRNASLECLTTDHSAFKEWETNHRLGKKPPDNIITRAIGPKEAVSPETSWAGWLAEDIYMLCSDGLTDMLAEEKIAEILQAENDVDIISSRLIEAANNEGGKDNVSAVVCQLL